MNETRSNPLTILADYAEKPVQRFLQIDGFVGVEPGDYVMRCDEDGDVIMFGTTLEMMRSPGRRLPARLLIHEDADPDDVRRLLTKMIDGLDQGFAHLHRKINHDGDPRYYQDPRFYEGDDPEGFVEEMKAKFGFDPSEEERWGQVVTPIDGGEKSPMYAFLCPLEHLDAVYDLDRTWPLWPLGS